MKRIFLSALVLTSLLTGCIKQDDTPIVLETGNTINNYYDGTGGSTGGTTTTDNVIDVTGAITENTTWTKDNIYKLNQKVVVSDGVTLTIQEGTIIKGAPGTGSLASALIVARGGIINAVGTPDEPIIFTSSQDNIGVGEIEGTNLDENDRGLWGGLIVLGKAHISVSGDNVEAQIEGIPADDTFGLYGGTDDLDNSGVIQYVSIRHGGALIGEGNEINGLTLGGVGSGTVIDHVEVVANVDDGIEYFGGTVSPTNVLIWAQGDDALDIDQAYAGTIDNAVVVQGQESDHCFEVDGPEGSYNGSFTVQNVTLIGIGDASTAGGEYADFRDGARGTIGNIYAYGFKDASDIELDDDLSATNYNDGILNFGTWEFVLPAGVADAASLFNNTTGVTVTGFGSQGSAVTMGSQTVGADTSEFGWTYTAGHINL